MIGIMKNVMKSGRLTNNSIKEYIAQLDNLNESQKKQLYKLDKYHYTDLILQIALLSNTFWPDDELKKYISKGMNHIKNSEYKEKLWSAKLNFTVNLMQYDLAYGDIKGFQSNHNILKSMMAEASGDYSKLLTIFNSTSSLLALYEKADLHNEVMTLLNYSQKYFSRKTLETDPVYELGAVMIDYYYAKNLVREKKFEKAIPVLENIFVYTKFNNTLNPKTISETIMVQNIIPLIIETYVEIGNYDKVIFYSNYYFQKEPENISVKDLKSLSTYYTELPEEGLRLYNSLLKYSIVKDSKKLQKNLVKFFDTKIIDYSKIQFSEKSTLKVSSDINVINYLAKISLGLLKIDNQEKLSLKILSFAEPKMKKHLNNQIYQTIWRPNKLDKEVSYAFLKASSVINKKDFYEKSYEIAQLSKNANTSRDLNKALKKQVLKGELGELINEYNNVEREILVTLRNEEFVVRDRGGKKNLVTSSQKIKDLNTKYNSLKTKISKLDKNYFNSLKVKAVSVKEIQKKLSDTDTLIDYFVGEEESYIIVINKNSFKLKIVNSNENKIKKLTKEIRDSFSISNKIIPFPVSTSFQLNQSLFLSVNENIKKDTRIFVVPDSYMNSVPLHLLSRETKSDCKNCSDINFNLYHNHFVYLPTTEVFVNLENYEDNYKYVKTASLNQQAEKLKKFSEKNKTITDSYKNIKKFVKDKKWKKGDKSKILSKTSAEKGYIGIGDPDLYASRSNNISEKQKITFIRGISDNKIKSEDIKSIYGPVNGSADELKIVSNFLDQLNTKILLKDEATEEIVKSQDFSNFDIIHFATHGEISGALSGYNEPFLVLTPPQKVTNEEDGLLTMSEIMGLTNNASLVVLSACNTASGDQTPSEGFSGLTKGFFIAGSKNLMVSNWYVETYSTKDLITSFFNEAKNNNNLSISKNLNNSMIKFIKENKDKSHPVFWAPFVIVGNDQKLNI